MKYFVKLLSRGKSCACFKATCTAPNCYSSSTLTHMSIPKDWSTSLEPGTKSTCNATPCPLDGKADNGSSLCLCAAEHNLLCRANQHKILPTLLLCVKSWQAAGLSNGSSSPLLCYSGSKYLQKPANREPRTIYGVEVCCTRGVCMCKLCIFGPSVISLKMRRSLKMWT